VESAAEDASSEVSVSDAPIVEAVVMEDEEEEAAQASTYACCGIDLA